MPQQKAGWQNIQIIRICQYLTRSKRWIQTISAVQKSSIHEGSSCNTVISPPSLTIYRIEALLKCADVNSISQHHHHLDNLFMIRRSTQSILKKGPDGGTVPLSEIMMPHDVFTAECSYEEREGVEFQHWHLLYAQYTSFLFLY
jgi:hypothetical protein